MISNSLNKNTGLVALGEIMMRLNCPHGKRFTDPGYFDLLFGGAEANVCVFLSGLGLPSRLVTRLPENDLAIGAMDRLRSHGVDTSCIAFGSGRMGLYFTENGNTLRPSRVIYDRKDSSFSTLVKGMIDWNQALQAARWFHWSGITPALSASAAEVCLEGILAAKQLGIPISVDLNYRNSLWDYGKPPSAVMRELIPYCDLVIGDLNAANKFFDITVDNKDSTEDQFRSCASTMKDKFEFLKSIAFTFRNQDRHHLENYQGALFSENEYYFSPIHAIPQVIDRIGSGDAFTAGLIYGVLKAFSKKEIIGFATACGILKHSIYGDFARISEKEVNLFIEQGPGSRVIR